MAHVLYLFLKGAVLGFTEEPSRTGTPGYMVSLASASTTS